MVRGTRKRKASTRAPSGTDVMGADVPGTAAPAVLRYGGNSRSPYARLGLLRTGAGPHSSSAAMYTRQHVLNDTVEKSGFKYLQEVPGHRSCINALAFSRGNGQWLASGGDDMRVHIRDMFDYDPGRSGTPGTSSYRTCQRLLGHTSNIFSLSWSCANKRLVSGGNDCRVLCYDLNMDDRPVDERRIAQPRRLPDMSIYAHEAGIREVSTHPTNPDLLLSSSDCGELFLTDLREPSAQVAGYGFFAAQLAASQWNPNESDGRTFAVASVGRRDTGVALYDIRTTFRGDDSYISRDYALVKYASSLTFKRDRDSAPHRGVESTSAQFDPTGRYIATDVSLFHPILYAVGNPEPLATMSSLDVHPELNPCLQDTTGPPGAGPGYRNSCTVKRGSFGLESQTGHLYYTTGSDDFRGYGWQIPPMEELVAQRESVSQTEWTDDAEKGKQRVWFEYEDADGNIRMVLPRDLAKPSFTLEGSRSIVNSALCHPTLPMIATSGIERLVRLHFATRSCLEHLREDYDVVRPQTRSRARSENRGIVARALRTELNAPSLEPDNDDEDEEEEEGEEESDEELSDTMDEGEESRDSPDVAHADLGDDEAIALFDELLRKEESRSLFRQGVFDMLDDDGEDDDEELDDGEVLATLSDLVDDTEM